MLTRLRRPVLLTPRKHKRAISPPAKSRWRSGISLFPVEIRRHHFARLLARHDWDDLKTHAEVAIVLEYPLLKQPEIVAFHQLKAAVEIGLDPAADIGQAF